MVFVQLLPPKQPSLQLLAQRRIQKLLKRQILHLQQTVKLNKLLLQQRRRRQQEQQLEQQHPQHHLLQPSQLQQLLQHVEIVKSNKTLLKLAQQQNHPQCHQQQELYQNYQTAALIKPWQVVQKSPTPMKHHYLHYLYPRSVCLQPAQQRFHQRRHHHLYLQRQQSQRQLRQQCKR